MSLWDYEPDIVESDEDDSDLYYLKVMYRKDKPEYQFWYWVSRLHLEEDFIKKYNDNLHMEVVFCHNDISEQLVIDLFKNHNNDCFCLFALGHKPSLDFIKNYINKIDLMDLLDNFQYNEEEHNQIEEMYKQYSELL